MVRLLPKKETWINYRLQAPGLEAALSRQNYKCAVCAAALNPKTRPEDCCADVHKETGAVRAALCAHCAKGLGYFRFSRQRVEKALEYLNKVDKAVE